MGYVFTNALMALTIKTMLGTHFSDIDVGAVL